MRRRGHRGREGREGRSPGRCPTGGWCSAGAPRASAGCSSSGRRTAGTSPRAGPGAGGLALQGQTQAPRLSGEPPGVCPFPEAPGSPRNPSNQPRHRPQGARTEKELPPQDLRLSSSRIWVVTAVTVTRTTTAPVGGLCAPSGMPRAPPQEHGQAQSCPTDGGTGLRGQRTLGGTRRGSADLHPSGPPDTGCSPERGDGFALMPARVPWAPGPHGLSGPASEGAGGPIPGS